MGILSLVMVGVYTLLQFALRWHHKMDDTVETYQQALRASSRMSYDLGTASQVSFLYS